MGSGLRGPKELLFTFRISRLPLDCVMHLTVRRSPEVYRQERYDERADVYSFSMIMYELLHRYMMISGGLILMTQPAPKSILASL